MIKNKLFIVFQYIAPQHLLSRIAGGFANCQSFFIKNIFISWFAKHFQVDLSEALEPDLKNYRSFNAFFTRALKQGVRPIDLDLSSIVSPSDGVISEIGVIKNDRLLQAKGQNYSLLQLVGGDEAITEKFQDGNFATVYLSPKDYHRVHMPIAGTLREMIFIPGKLFSVNAITANHVPNLFARNERVVCIFDTEYGQMAVILVGAMIVASIETIWAGVVAPQRNEITHIRYNENSLPTVSLQKGVELGRFLLGSTVIVLFEKEMVSWQKNLSAGSTVKMGQTIGNLKI